MPYLRQNGKLVFFSSGDVLMYYAALIEQLTPQLEKNTGSSCQAIQAEIADLRQALAEQLKNFGHSQVESYFDEAITGAESIQEQFALSNAYETILLFELGRIKEKLHTLRTTGNVIQW